MEWHFVQNSTGLPVMSNRWINTTLLATECSIQLSVAQPSDRSSMEKVFACKNLAKNEGFEAILWQETPGDALRGLQVWLDGSVNRW